MNSKTVLNRQYEIAPQLVEGANIRPSGLGYQLNQIWRSLSRYLSRSNEPQVWQVRSHSNEIRWRVFDPMSERTLFYNTEEEVRIWLEQSRYQ